MYHMHCKNASDMCIDCLLCNMSYMPFRSSSDASQFQFWLGVHSRIFVYEGKSEQELVTSTERNATLDECRKLVSEDVVSGLQVQPVSQCRQCLEPYIA
jgi:hypothetical protein